MTTTEKNSDYIKHACGLYEVDKPSCGMTKDILKSLLTEAGPNLYHYNNAMFPSVCPTNEEFDWSISSICKNIIGYVHDSAHDYCKYGGQGMFSEEHIGLLLCASLAYHPRDSSAEPLTIGRIHDKDKDKYFNDLLDELNRGARSGTTREIRDSAKVALNYVNLLIKATTIDVVDISGFRPVPFNCLFEGTIPVILLKMKVGNAPERTVMSIMGTYTGTTCLTDLHLFGTPHKRLARRCQERLQEVVKKWIDNKLLMSNPDFATGHSLGGILSMVCCRFVNIDVVAFCAPMTFPEEFYDTALGDKCRIFMYNHAQDSYLTSANFAIWLWPFNDVQKGIVVIPDRRHHQVLIIGDCTQSILVTSVYHKLAHVLAPMAYYRSVRDNCTNGASRTTLVEKDSEVRAVPKSTLAEHHEREKKEYHEEQRTRQLFEVVTPTIITAIIDKWTNENRSYSYASLATYMQTFSAVAKPALNALKHYSVEYFDGTAGNREAMLVEILHGCVISELCKGKNDGRAWCVTVNLLAHGVNFMLSMHGFVDHHRASFLVNGIVIPVLIRCEPNLFKQYMEYFIPPATWSNCECFPPLTAKNIEQVLEAQKILSVGYIAGTVVGEVQFLSNNQQEANTPASSNVSLVIADTAFLSHGTKTIDEAKRAYDVRTTIRIISAAHNTAIELTLDLVPSCNKLKLVGLAGLTGGALVASVASGGAFIAQAGITVSSAQGLAASAMASEALTPVVMIMKGSSEICYHFCQVYYGCGIGAAGFFSSGIGNISAGVAALSVEGAGAAALAEGAVLVGQGAAVVGSSLTALSSFTSTIACGSAVLELTGSINTSTSAQHTLLHTRFAQDGEELSVDEVNCNLHSFVMLYLQQNNVIQVAKNKSEVTGTEVVKINMERVADLFCKPGVETKTAAEAERANIFSEREKLEVEAQKREKAEAERANALLEREKLEVEAKMREQKRRQAMKAKFIC